MTVGGAVEVEGTAGGGGPAGWKKLGTTGYIGGGGVDIKRAGFAI